MKKHIIALIGLGLLATGCSGTKPAEPQASGTPVAASSTPEPAEPKQEAFSEEVIKKAEALLAAREKGKIPYKELSVKENGPAFVYLATTSEEPEVVVQALQGMDKTHRSDKESEKMNLAGDSFDAAILKNLGSDNKELVYYSLKSSGDALGAEPNAEIVTKLIDIGTNSKEVGARLEALEALYRVKDFEKDPKIMDVFLKGLKDDAPIASTSLFRRQYGWKEIDKKDELKSSIEALLSHDDPGVRGRAVDAMGAYYSDDVDYILPKIETALKDKDAFVRSSAVGVLSRVKSPKSVELIMSLVDDKTKNTYDIKYTDLRGNSDRVHHDGSAWSRVDDAALSSLKSATYMLGEGKRFEYGKIDYKKVDEDIAREVAKAKAWFETYKKG